METKQNQEERPLMVKIVTPKKCRLHLQGSVSLRFVKVTYVPEKVTIPKEQSPPNCISSSNVN